MCSRVHTSAIHGLSFCNLKWTPFNYAIPLWVLSIMFSLTIIVIFASDLPGILCSASYYILTMNTFKWLIIKSNQTGFPFQLGGPENIVLAYISLYLASEYAVYNRGLGGRMPLHISIWRYENPTAFQHVVEKFRTGITGFSHSYDTIYVDLGKTIKNLSHPF